MKTAMTRVAIVEDDAHLRSLFADWVSSASHLKLVAACDSAETAIATLPGTPADIVLMDINLPGQDGIECVRALKASRPATLFLMVTVYDDAQRIFQALAAGATGYLLKRATRAELLAAIEELQAGGSPMSSSIARKVVQSFQQPSQPNVSASAPLSEREREVLELLVQGYVYKEIGDNLGITVPTVGTHVRHIYDKLHVQSRAQAVAKFRSR
ncbi:MAG: response regulator transcription factor [bacterium]